MKLQACLYSAGGHGDAGAGQADVLVGGTGSQSCVVTHRRQLLTNVDFTAAIADAKLICNLHRFAAVNEAATTARVRLCHITLPQPSRSDGTTENARPENAGRSKMQGVENEYGKLVCE